MALTDASRHDWLEGRDCFLHTLSAQASSHARQVDRWIGAGGDHLQPEHRKPFAQYGRAEDGLGPRRFGDRSRRWFSG